MKKLLLSTLLFASMSANSAVDSGNFSVTYENIYRSGNTVNFDLVIQNKTIKHWSNVEVGISGSNDYQYIGEIKAAASARMPYSITESAEPEKVIWDVKYTNDKGSDFSEVRD